MHWTLVRCKTCPGSVRSADGTLRAVASYSLTVGCGSTVVPCCRDVLPTGEIHRDLRGRTWPRAEVDRLST